MASGFRFISGVVFPQEGFSKYVGDGLFCCCHSVWARWAFPRLRLALPTLHSSVLSHKKLVCPRTSRATTKKHFPMPFCLWAVGHHGSFQFPTFSLFPRSVSALEGASCFLPGELGALGLSFMSEALKLQSPLVLCPVVLPLGLIISDKMSAA